MTQVEILVQLDYVTRYTKKNAGILSRIILKKV